MGMLPFTLGLILGVRWAYLQFFTDEVASRVPSLVMAAVAFLVAVQLWVFAFVADLLSANRRVLADIRASQRATELS